MLVGFQNLTLHLYDLDTNKIDSDLYGHNGAVMDAYAFSEDERKVISASDDCTLRLWDLKNVEGVDKWCYTKSIIGAETPLQAAYAKMENLRYISNDNLKVFEEKYAKVSAADRFNQPYDPRLIDNELVKYRQKIGI
jgi:WD40 repeat protein